MNVGISSHFKKMAKKLSQTERQVLDEKIEWFVNNPSDPRLKTHALTGRLKGYFSFSISFKKRVVFIFVSEDEAILIDVGSHDEVYR